MKGHKKFTSYLVDTNIFLRVLIHDDQKTWQDCMGVLRLIEERNIEAFIPNLVFAEVQFVFTSFYGFPKNQTLTALKSMAAVKNLHFFDDLSCPLAIDLSEKHNVKFTDCLLASSERIQRGIAGIISYDRDFDKLKIPSFEPHELLT